MIIGFACGLAAGAIIALVLPRDDGPRRRTLTFDPALDPGPDLGLDPGPAPRAVADGPAVADAEAPGPTRTAGSGERPGA